MKLRLFLGMVAALAVLTGLVWVLSSHALNLREQLAEVNREMEAIEQSVKAMQLSSEYLRTELGKTSANVQRINREFNSLGATDEVIREHINIAVPAELSRLLNEARTRVSNTPTITVQSTDAPAGNL